MDYKEIENSLNFILGELAKDAPYYIKETNRLIELIGLSDPRPDEILSVVHCEGTYQFLVWNIFFQYFSDDDDEDYEYTSVPYTPHLEILEQTVHKTFSLEILKSISPKVIREFTDNIHEGKYKQGSDNIRITLSNIRQVFTAFIMNRNSFAKYDDPVSDIGAYLIFIDGLVETIKTLCNVYTVKMFGEKNIDCGLVGIDEVFNDENVYAGLDKKIHKQWAPYISKSGSPRVLTEELILETLNGMSQRFSITPNSFDYFGICGVDQYNTFLERTLPFFSKTPSRIIPSSFSNYNTGPNTVFNFCCLDGYIPIFCSSHYPKGQIHFYRKDTWKFLVFGEPKAKASFNFEFGCLDVEAKFTAQLQCKNPFYQGAIHNLVY